MGYTGSDRIFKNRIGYTNRTGLDARIESEGNGPVGTNIGPDRIRNVVETAASDEVG